MAVAALLDAFRHLVLSEFGGAGEETVEAKGACREFALGLFPFAFGRFERVFQDLVRHRWRVVLVAKSFGRLQ